MSIRFKAILISGICLAYASTLRAPAQQLPNSTLIPRVDVVPAPSVQLPGAVDSNSPAFWQYEEGRNRLYVLTSWAIPSISQGISFRRLRSTQPVRFSNSVNGGRWMESVLQDSSGTLYGYYHHEPLGLCGKINKTAPRIGAARSFDNGLSWEDLGIILEAPMSRADCGTPNEFFVGGFGDFTVILNNDQTDAYFFFSSYVGPASRQGVVVARMLWSQRDTPRGNLEIWNRGVWGRPQSRFQTRPSVGPQPIYPAVVSWHDDSGQVDSFWGPSVHWNTFLNQYVMLLNRAVDSSWTQEGIYIAFSPVLHDPSQWTTPLKILEGGPWYPQVLGLEKDTGTDKVAGSVARLFLRGQSDYYLVFKRISSTQSNNDLNGTASTGNPPTNRAIQSIPETRR